MKVEKKLQEKYPGLGVLEARIHGVNIFSSNTDFERLKKLKQDEIRERVPFLDVVRDLPSIRAYRDFYWSVGIDPTKTRPAGEALLRRILGGRDLPTINTLVDSYNLASAETMISIAAFDLSKIHPEDLVMRTALTGDSFRGIGMQSEMKLSGSEVVIEDTANKHLIAVYPYRDADESKVTQTTSDVLFMMCGVPGISEENLRIAEKITREYVGKYCKGS